MNTQVKSSINVIFCFLSQFYIFEGFRFVLLSKQFDIEALLSKNLYYRWHPYSGHLSLKLYTVWHDNWISEVFLNPVLGRIFSSHMHLHCIKPGTGYLALSAILCTVVTTNQPYYALYPARNWISSSHIMHRIKPSNGYLIAIFCPVSSQVQDIWQPYYCGNDSTQ